MTVKDIDLQRVLHIYTVETLYAAVVEARVDPAAARGYLMLNGLQVVPESGDEPIAAGAGFD